MNDLKRTSDRMRRLEVTAQKKGWLNDIHPTSKLFVTLACIILVISINQYNLPGLLGMCIYPVVLFVIGEISIKEFLYRLRIILPLVCLVGIFNPVFDKRPMFYIGSFCVTYGVISMITLMLKGVLTISAAYLLASTTHVEKICAALRHLHFPKMIVTVILLIYRYMSLLMSEASRMTQAYMLRAPGHKGIHIKAWGSFAGNLLIRSIDKAKTVYDSMILRGFDGEINYTGYKKMSVNDYVYMMVWFVVLLVIRTFM